MKRNIILISVLSLIVFAGTSCKKNKVSDNWYISKAIDLEDQSDITSDYTGEVWTFEKDGTYRENGDIKGTWEFTSEKDYLTIRKSSSDDIDNFKILLLTNKEMWLEILGKEELHLNKYE